MKAVIYSRVSTQKQDLERQINELQIYARSNDLEVMEVFSEKISGSISERLELERMIEFIENPNNKIEKVLVWEFTRLGRSTIGTLTNINRIKRSNVSIYIHKGAMNIDPINTDHMANFMLTILTAVAELEKEQIVSRLQSGRKHRKANGGIFGRKPGSTKAIEETRNYIEIARLLKQGVRISHVSKITSCARNTVYKIKKSL